MSSFWGNAEHQLVHCSVLQCTIACACSFWTSQYMRGVQSTSGSAHGGADLATKQAALNGRAYGQFKSVAFLCFVMWMSGSQIHLFSIMTTVSGIYQPLMAIVNSEKSMHACYSALHLQQTSVLSTVSVCSVPRGVI